MIRTISPQQKTEFKPYHKGKLGVPTKLTPELTERILTSIRMGNYVDVAAIGAGIPRDRIKEWLFKGAKGHRTYKQFTLDISQAIAESEERDLSLIDMAAMQGFWQAAAWKLERKFPNRWGKIQKVEMTGAEGGPIETHSKMDLGKLSVDQLMQLRQIVSTALQEIPIQGDELVVGGNGHHG